MDTVRSLRSVLIVVTTLAVAGCTSVAVGPPTTPAIDLSATPSGWIPVAYGDAQLSVPADWNVFVGDGLCADALPGYASLGPAQAIFACGPTADHQPASAAALMPIDRTRAQRLPSVNIDGIHALAVNVTCAQCLVYEVPSLGVTVSAIGPLRQQVMDTLTASPRAVVLAPGPAPPVPSSWHWLSFAGIRFAVPSSWPVLRTNNYTQPCDPTSVTLGLLHEAAALSTDRDPSGVGCFYGSPLVKPVNGVMFNSGLFSLGIASHRCWSLHAVRACEVTYPYSVLVLNVTVPGRAKPVVASIGFAGNGMVARTILYSLRAA